MSREPIYWIGQGDRADPLIYTPVDAYGETVNLSLATSVTFRMHKPMFDTPKVDDTDNASVVAPGPDNYLQYDWQPADVDEAGLFAFYFLVTMPGPRTRRFPDDGYDYLQVTPS